MREIEFRGKSKETGNWLYGDLVRNIYGDFAIVPAWGDGFMSCDKYEVSQETIGQYVGMHDKNGKKIYEGDILHIVDLEEEFDWLTEVMEYGKVQICRKHYDFPFYTTIGLIGNDDCFEFEVIGNIYDNPELLEPSEEEQECQQ